MPVAPSKPAPGLPAFASPGRKRAKEMSMRKLGWAAAIAGDSTAPAATMPPQDPLMLSPRRVILLVEAASAYGRGCLRGIARYARAHGGWVFFHGTRYLVEPPDLHELLDWQADGVIARIETPRIAHIVRELGLPAVDLRGPHPLPGIWGIYTDDRKVIEMATEHLLSNGLQHLAFCGYPGVDFSDARQDIFLQHDPGHRLAFSPPRRPARSASYERRGREDSVPLQQWLAALPKPIGIIACNDTRGRQVLQACAAAGIKVPYEVAVVGVDDDDVLCELSNPSLSSVAPNLETIGFTAAQLLASVLEGKRPPTTPILVPPVAVEVRSSSDVLALSDPALVAAIRLIRARISSGVNVKEILSELGMSRSTFERQFRQQLGCSPYDYILNHRVQRVRQLLNDTSYPLARIARLSGFKSLSHMTAVFRTHTGITPARYRRGEA